MPLATRLLLARKRHADMLISLHADWNSDPRVKGVSVYSQSNYAVNKYAERFLQDAAPKIIHGEDWGESLPSAHGILYDIMQRDTLNRSILLSRSLLREIRLYSPVLDRPHRFADLHLLSAPDLPAVLVEVGFLSNQEDLEKLTSKKWRAGLSRRIVAGVKAYFRQLQAHKAQKSDDRNRKMAYDGINPKALESKE